MARPSTKLLVSERFSGRGVDNDDSYVKLRTAILQRIVKAVSSGMSIEKAGKTVRMKLDNMVQNNSVKKTKLNHIFEQAMSLAALRLEK